MILAIIHKAFGIALILIGLASLQIKFLRMKLKNERLNALIKEKEMETLQARMLDDVKTKINRSQNLCALDKDDVKARYLYSQDGIKDLANDLKIALSDKHAALKKAYPQLTDLDMLVISLMIIGMDNDDICEIIKMEKRTLYRRRQLIAQRIGISSNDIEEFVMTTFC